NGHVKITGRKEKGNLILEVEDTGIGMTQHEQSIVFEEFTQAHSDIEKQFGGTGLGLTISKRMAELLGGTIHIKSEKEKDLYFRLFFLSIEIFQPKKLRKNQLR